MNVIAKILIGILAIEYLFILWIEMFAWTTKGEKFFPHLEKDFLLETKSMAANQGLYNGFLAAGLIWSLFITTSAWSYSIAIFFTGCAIVAGIYGTFTVSKSVFFKQGLPAIITMIVLIISRIL